MATKITFPSWNEIVKAQLDKINILRGTYQSNGIIKNVRNMEDFHCGAKQFGRLAISIPKVLKFLRLVLKELEMVPPELQ
jgi:hypothetical protein